MSKSGVNYSVELLAGSSPIDLSPKFPPALGRVLGLMLPYAACYSSASFTANSLGVRLPREECGRSVL